MKDNWRVTVGIAIVGISIGIFGLWGLLSLIVALPFIGWHNRYKGPLKVASENEVGDAIRACIMFTCLDKTSHDRSADLGSNDLVSSWIFTESMVHKVVFLMWVFETRFASNYDFGTYDFFWRCIGEGIPTEIIGPDGEGLALLLQRRWVELQMLPEGGKERIRKMHYDSVLRITAQSEGATFDWDKVMAYFESDTELFAAWVFKNYPVLR